MVEITVQMPEKLAVKATRWLKTILELNMIEFQTSAAMVANETIRFLLDAPTAADLLAHKPSATAQARLRRLLTLNQAELLGEVEQRELDELEQIEHIMRITKLQIAAQMQNN